jgi:hypothetical protein
MTLVRRWPALGAIPPIDSYGCERCGIVCSATDLGDVTVADQITAQYLELCRDRQEKRKAGVPQCVQ